MSKSSSLKHYLRSALSLGHFAWEKVRVKNRNISKGKVSYMVRAVFL